MLRFVCSGRALCGALLGSPLTATPAVGGSSSRRTAGRVPLPQHMAAPEPYIFFALFSRQSVASFGTRRRKQPVLTGSGHMHAWQPQGHKTISLDGRYTADGPQPRQLVSSLLAHVIMQIMLMNSCHGSGRRGDVPAVARIA